MNLNEGNYFSIEANRDYMSASQLKSFLTCPARTIAELNGLYQREETTALLIGSCVDAHFSGALNDFLASHKQQVYTRTGGFRAEFQQAMDIITLLENDDLLHRMLQGETQKIVTGEIAGVPFRGKLDGLLSAEQCQAIAEEWPEMAADLMMADGAIVDLKCVKDLEPVWVSGRGKVSVSDAWRWDLQLGIYQQLVGGNLPCFIVAVTKEKTPDKCLIRIPHYMMSAAVESAQELIPRFQAMKKGREEAPRCGKCNYCRQTKVISGAVDADELDGSVL